MEQSEAIPAENPAVKESKQLLTKKINLVADKKSPARGSKASSPFKLLPVLPSHIEQKDRLQTAFKLSLTGGVFIDTKFYAFSRRKSSKVVDRPLPVFANSSMLRAASPYFEGCEWRWLLLILHCCIDTYVGAL